MLTYVLSLNENSTNASFSPVNFSGCEKLNGPTTLKLLGTAGATAAVAGAVPAEAADPFVVAISLEVFLERECSGTHGPLP